MLKTFQKGNETCLQFKVHSMESGACSTAHRSNRPGHSDSLVLRQVSGWTTFIRIWCVTFENFSSLYMNFQTGKLKTAHSHMMPPLLHLSNICCKCFLYRRSRDSQIMLLKHATKMLYNCQFNNLNLYVKSLN